MRTLVTLAAAAVLSGSTVVLPTCGHAKQLPPAFGKELVPDAQSKESNESKAVETEDEEDGPKRSGRRPSRGGGSGQKIRIQLDGDEGGGGDDIEDGGDDGL